MSSENSRRRVIVIVLGVIVLAAAAGGVYYWTRRPPQVQLPGPGDPRYETYVSAFQTGTAYLDAGLSVEAEKFLTEAVEIIPEEPAGWANRAIVHMRGVGEEKLAAHDLDKARQLAPNNPELEEIAGYLAEKNYKYADALRYFRKASEASPNNTRRLFKIADLIAKEAEPDAQQQRIAIFARILQIDPDNLPMLGKLAHEASLANDLPTVRKVVTQMERLSGSWSENSRTQLAKLKKAVEAPGSTAVEAEAYKMNNLLMGEKGYAASMAKLSSSTDAEIGVSFQSFLRLAPVKSVPSEPDLQLTFKTLEPPTLPELQVKSWLGALPFWLDGTSKPNVWVFDSQQVRSADSAKPLFDFPGGSDHVAPTSTGILALDWDNDRKTDFLLAGAGGLRFHHQIDLINVAAMVAGEGACTKLREQPLKFAGYFEDVTAKMNLPADILAGNYYGAWAVDIDFDGDLDILLARRNGEALLLRNNFDGTLTVQPMFPGVNDVRAFAWVDLDNDGAADAALLDGSGRLHIFMNRRKGVFVRRAPPDELQKFCALTVADANNDGVLDLAAITESGSLLRICDRDQGASWDVAELGKIESALPLTLGTAQLIAIDLDNNGAIDLILRTPSGGSAWLADAKGAFHLLSVGVPRGVAPIVDLKEAGELDFLGLDEQGRIQLHAAVGTKDYQWLVVKARSANAEGDNRVNSFGLGGSVEARTGLLVTNQPIDSPVIHIGLGSHKNVDLIKIVWPNGASQHEFRRVPATAIYVEQRLKGSCPFLYSWDGEKMVFVTDFCWSTPLGMYINAQDQGGFAQTTDWVKIRGDQLVPRNGIYDVRVNANLWETHYLDELGLMVVDHLPFTEMYVDERFFLEPTNPQVYLTEPSKPVARAWDHKGQDVTDIVREVDGNYLDRAGRGVYQGVTNDHWVEVDLGEDAPKTGTVYLLGTGWIHPTDSSINFALEQNKSIKPQPLTLEIPDGKGGWKVGRGGLGFLAGKNKTCVIRLDGIEGEQVSHRFRLRTNMEIYWDALRYAQGLDPNSCKLQRLTAQSAELSFRGILNTTQANPSSPELPHYDEVVVRGQRWRDLIGFYTRFGDVRELIEKADDRYVIMNAGDELRFTFAVPKRPHPDWVRDFVWICDGWVKDGDLNTRWGKTVLPLPYHGMPSYDSPPGKLEDDPVYRRFPNDWLKYHTRYVTPYQYERGLRAFRDPR
jgi:Tfp pilus assembly protein PilF